MTLLSIALVLSARRALGYWCTLAQAPPPGTLVCAYYSSSCHTHFRAYNMNMISLGRVRAILAIGKGH